MNRRRVAVLISGRGSNMAALLEAAAGAGYPAEIALVISDRPEAPGLELARRRKVPTLVLGRDSFASRDAHESAVEKALRSERIEIVCLAGYMRVLSADFVARWSGRLINVHPALLPLFPGLDTHRRALEAGVLVHGATVHFVTAEVDAGPIIAQAAVPVHPGDTEAALAARVLAAEHGIYPLALRLVAEGHAALAGGRAVFSGFDLPPERTGQVVSPFLPHSRASVEDLARFTP